MRLRLKNGSAQKERDGVRDKVKVVIIIRRVNANINAQKLTQGQRQRGQSEL